MTETVNRAFWEVNMELLDQEKKDLLESSKVIAMVGLSPKTDKPSNRVANYLKEHGYRVIPVNPQHEEILGEKSYKSLSDIPDKVDVVDIFMRAENVVPVIEEAIKIKPKAIWLQLGIVNDQAKAIAEKNGVGFVQNLCIKLEHARLLQDK
jgi:predicted CoA-binding protein